MALCLSGGGYRAMVFHIGVLWRLNEAKLLPKLQRISSVSGGSITAGVLATHWPGLRFQDDIAAGFQKEVVEPLRQFASRTIDAGAIVGGIFLPGTIAERVANAYRTHLFGSKTLADLPESSSLTQRVFNPVRCGGFRSRTWRIIASGGFSSRPRRLLWRLAPHRHFLRCYHQSSFI
jgi:NTE family protein